MDGDTAERIKAARTTCEAWLGAEPDADIRIELQSLLDGDSRNLTDRFEGELTFGTAGLRAPIGAGPRRMNRLVVRRAAAGVVDALVAADPLSLERGLLIGYDARFKSRDFAFDTARVAAARGMRARVTAVPVPTPVLAWNITRLGVAAGIMVTASHNPAADNGYKVYLGTGAQIVPPWDADIAARISALDPVGIELAEVSDDLIEVLGDDVVDTYLGSLSDAGGGRPGVRIAYTALHGVGGSVAQRAFVQAGFTDVTVVDAQQDPDPTFPTVAFPNPEEPGAMDLVLATAQRIDADIALAHDPDADRLGVAVPTVVGAASGPRWRLLSGDEIGWLLAEHILRNSNGDDRLLVTTVVSSSLLGKMAAAAGVHFAETYTGFKWIADAVVHRPDLHLVFAYEQALGYLVRDRPLDKDGISAALVMAELATELKAAGRSFDDQLDMIAERFGRHITAEAGVRMEPTEAIAAVDRLRRNPPSEIGGRRVLEVQDFPEAMLLRIWVEGNNDSGRLRLQVRPSGTEPKIKVYGEGVGEDPRSLVQSLTTLL
ncbi:MAG: phospho-sugar mutase [Ilumatobacteraceae bacterium]